MVKKLIIVMVLLVLAVGGFFLYRYYSHQNSQIQNQAELTPEKLLVFQIKNSNLSAELVQAYQAKFYQLKGVLQQNPDAFNDWLTLAILKKTVNDFEGARDIWLYGAKIRPQSSSPWASLGDLYANFLKEPDKAEEAYKKAIEIEPTDYTFYLALADLYRYNIPGKETLYEQTILDALQRFPENINLIAPLAGYFRQTKQTDKAILWYEKLVSLDPRNETAKEDLAELKAQK